MQETEVTQTDEAVQDSPEEETSTVEQEPEPATGERTDEGETDAEPSSETQETDSKGTDDDWLPDEQKKEFPLDVLAEFANKRNYNFSKDDIAKNLGIQNLLKDKLNADIYIHALTHNGDGEETDELGQFLAEDGLEVSEEEGRRSAEPATTVPPDFRAEHYQRVDNLVTQVDPQVTEELGRNVLSVLGVNVDPRYLESLQAQLRDGNTAPAQRAEIQSYLDTINGAGKLGGTLSRGALDLFLTALPAVLPEVIEQVYPGTQLRYQRGVAAESWDGLSQAIGKDQKPLYPNLPRFGTPEYKKMVVKVEKGMGLPLGGLGAMSFKDESGRPLPVERQLQATMRLIARAASGQRISPKVVSQALQAGAQKERDQAQRRAQGRALGSGQPTSSTGSPTGNEDIFGPGQAEYKRRGG